MTHHSSSVKVSYGVSFVGSISDLYAVQATAVTAKIFCYIWPPFNGTQMYWYSVEHLSFITQFLQNYHLSYVMVPCRGCILWPRTSSDRNKTKKQKQNGLNLRHMYLDGGEQLVSVNTCVWLYILAIVLFYTIISCCFIPVGSCSWL